MDPRDDLDSLAGGVDCAACGETVPTDRIRLLARRDDIAFVEVTCPSCRSDSLGIVIDETAGSGAGDRIGRVYGEFGPADIERFRRARPIAATDVSFDDAGREDRPLPSFAHASEAEMGRILDFYRIRWEYEPHTFPILWNLDGVVIESFSPDFWLPDLDLYLEMTTLRQKLVRKKNRKLRRVLELYPDLRVKLFYARDFRALMLKFGKLGLVAELSGTSGQVVPVRVDGPMSASAIELSMEPGPPTFEELPQS